MRTAEPIGHEIGREGGRGGGGQGFQIEIPLFIQTSQLFLLFCL